MLIYESDLLSSSFEKENDCFVQYWKHSPDCYEELKREFLEYASLYKEYRPSKSLWLQHNFKLPISNQVHEWIEEHVNIPCVEHGNEKVAFVVGKDVLVHLSVMSFFEESNSIIHPMHFATEKEARQWLNDSKNHPKGNNKLKVLFEGVDKEGNSIIKIKRSASDITNTLMSFGKVVEENKFIKSNISRYSRLTKREKQVMIEFSKGLPQQDVADKLYISVGTLRTHWKNIKSKLEIKSLAEVIKYVNAFDMYK
ncbi:LuxR C-terminal-related transcriptional regulator [Gramella lutea]|uniref:LuxR C-terminal-related transcriptional regulator n=1 Tax=Christiangramia lutea TaxID=1607951 RepID=A0A9X1V5F2_9FLAO|nr:LuxR C-terminal-related transcriptional regulator [Christiangramia lutea]MCH4824446.1 LuxR C-terminal-related transcriptional regulator [Christiangramia lutea]